MEGKLELAIITEDGQVFAIDIGDISNINLGDFYEREDVCQSIDLEIKRIREHE